MMAKRNPDKNVLGVDIRAPLVERGNAWGARRARRQPARRRVQRHPSQLVRGCRPTPDECQSEVELVAIQFGPALKKKRHHKRRVVQPALVRAVAEVFDPARVFLQWDVRGF